MRMGEIYERSMGKKKTKKPGKTKKLTSAQKRNAMRRAAKAGRPYPNLIDNMSAAK